MIEELLATGDREIYPTPNQWVRVVRDLIDLEREDVGPLGPFERDFIIQRHGPAPVIRELAKAREYSTIVCARGYAMAMDVNDFPPASFTAVNTTTTETELWNPAIWTPVPANDPRAGKAYRATYGGVLGTAGAGPTLQFQPRWSQSTATPPTGTTLGISTAPTLTASLSSVPFYGTFTYGWRTIGVAASGGTGTGNGFVAWGGAAGAAGVILPMGGTVTSSVDQTTAQGLLIGVIWGTSSASNTITAQWAVMQSYN